MPHGYMNLPEVAVLLGLDHRLAEKLAQRGKIPCQKVGGQLRFNRAEITEWAQRTLGTFERPHLDSMDAGITAHRQRPADEAIIAPLLQEQAVSVHLPARTKNSVLKELVVLAGKTGLLYDEQSLLEALIQREEISSTAIEGGIAIPHPKRPLPYAVAEPILVFAHIPQGIGFGARDGRLTSLFFMTCSQDDHHHLHILARLCRMLHDANFVDSLRQAVEPAQIVNLLRQRELALLSD